MLLGQQTRDQPETLTVEEAASVLRIGRTKAYAMTKEWRATNGRSGLPVIDLGGVLRVPRRAIDRLLDTAVSGIEASAPNPPALGETADAREPRRGPRRRHARDRDQPTLIDLT